MFFSWLVEKYKNVTSMLMRFWSKISRMFLCMFLLLILRLKNVYSISNRSWRREILNSNQQYSSWKLTLCLILLEAKRLDKYIHIYLCINCSRCDGKLTKIPKRDFYFRTCEDEAGWHLIPYIISPRSEFFSQAYKNWHIMWGTNLGPDWPPLARGSKFHTITHPPGR